MEIQLNNQVRLGEGGYGSVFPGTFKGREVAVKRVLLIDATNDREENILKQLDDPNIVKCFHIETDDTFKYFALELCAASLDQLFLEPDHAQKYQGPELPHLSIVFFQLASGLEHIHSRNLIHRDIKPENVLIYVDSITDRVTMKWADFGLSRPVNQRGTFTMKSGITGTKNWYAPELLKLIEEFNQPKMARQWRGTVKSDVFAVALVFAYLLLQGEHLYGSNEYAIYGNIMKNEPVNMDKIGKSHFAFELIKKMLTSDPQSRITSADVVIELKVIRNELTMENLPCLQNPSPLYETCVNHNEAESLEARPNSVNNIRLATHVATQRCTSNKRVDDEMTLHKLKLNEICTFSEISIIKRFSFGEPNPALIDIPRKTILLIGATGSGKTTMINAIINYILGVNWDDPFRFILVDEKVRGASQAHSQTEGVTAYDLHYENGFHIPFSLTIVDTPGFGNTNEIEHNKNITLAVEKFFKAKNGIQELDLVGFVVQSSLANLTDLQQNIFSSVLKIFGEDIKENVRFLITFSNERPFPVLGAIKEAKLLCQMDSNGLPRHQNFNNCAIYQSKIPTSNTQSLQLQWEDGIKNFKSFFEELNDVPTKSLHRTQVIDLENCLKTQLDSALSSINGQLMKMEELRKTEEHIILNRDKVDDNKDFEIKVQVSKKVRGSIDNMSVINCKREEFLPNMVSETNLINTSSMQFCLNQCSTGDYMNENSQVDLLHEKTKTFYEIRKKYEDVKGTKLQPEAFMNALKEDIYRLKENIIDEIKKIARSSNALKNERQQDSPRQYILTMIENEKKDETAGSMGRIRSLEDLLKFIQTNT